MTVIHHLSPEPELWNHFLCGDFKETNCNQEFSVIDDQIIRNLIFFVCGFYRCANHSQTE